MMDAAMMPKDKRKKTQARSFFNAPVNHPDFFALIVS
jgi:hypothetical protein